MRAGSAPLTIAVLVSGRGSNLQAIIDATARGDLPVALKVVVSDQAEAQALARARDAGIPALVLPGRDHPDRASYDEALTAILERYDVQLLVLAGFMRILGAEFVDAYRGRALNIHPSLLPRYRGLHTHRRVLEHGDREHGASVHYVTAELDGGPVIIQARIPVRAGDDEASLSARVQQREHIIYPRVINWIATGRLELRDDIPWLDGWPLKRPIVWEFESDPSELA